MKTNQTKIVLVSAGLALTALTVTGCKGTISPEAAKGLEDLSHGVSKADESARGFYAYALSLCEDDACQAKLKELAAPMIDGFQVIRAAWCMIKPEAETCNEQVVPKKETP